MEHLSKLLSSRPTIFSSETPIPKRESVRIMSAVNNRTVANEILLPSRVATSAKRPMSYMVQKKRNIGWVESIKLCNLDY